MADTELQQLAKTDRNPIQETRYQELMRQQGSSGSGGGGGMDYAAIAREQMKLMQEANQPAIQSLQASIPETQQKYAAESAQLKAQQEPLDKRYQNLLSEVTRQQGIQTSAEQTATSREFGRRGISLQSGIFDQTLNERLKPISEWAGGQTTQIGLSREDALRQLQNLIQNTELSGMDAVRGIQNAIAQLQAGGAQSGITNALSIWNANRQNELAQKELALKETAANAKVNVDPLEQALTMAKIANMGASTARLQRLASGGGGGSEMGFDDFIDALNKI